MSHHNTSESYSGEEGTAMQSSVATRILFTIVVGLNNWKTEAGGGETRDQILLNNENHRAVALDKISRVHASRPKSILRLMCQEKPTEQDIELVNLVDQISFYLDVINGRGVFSGVIDRDHLDIFGSTEHFCRRIIKETKLSEKDNVAEISGFSWVLVDLDLLAPADGQLIITGAAGSLGGR